MTLADRKPPTQAEYEAYRRRFCNWTRWGPHDEMGTLNFITDEVRRQVFACVQSARPISLARPIDTQPGPANPFPSHHFVPAPGAGGMLDYIGMFIHGVRQTHIDALCHMPTADGSQTWRGMPMGSNGMPFENSGTVSF